MSYKVFARRHNIRMSADRADENPNMLDMPAGSSHWKCVLRCDGRQLTVFFSQDPAITKEPTVDDVLACLAMDSACMENARDFWDWCREMGFDHLEDGPRAEQCFEACQRQAIGLKRVLGDDLYQKLLWEE